MIIRRGWTITTAGWHGNRVLIERKALAGNSRLSAAEATQHPASSPSRENRVTTPPRRSLSATGSSLSSLFRNGQPAFPPCSSYPRLPGREAFPRCFVCALSLLFFRLRPRTQTSNPQSNGLATIIRGIEVVPCDRRLAADHRHCRSDRLFKLPRL